MEDEIKSCVCKNTGEKIGCEECIQPIVDTNINRKGCSYIPERSEERRVGKECRSRWSPYH